jgi:hypothetical protein
MRPDALWWATANLAMRSGSIWAGHLHGVHTLSTTACSAAAGSTTDP